MEAPENDIALGPPSKRRSIVRIIGLLGGPLVALTLYVLLPTQYTGIDGELVTFTHAGRAALAVMGWMATWWLTEALDISATALLPIALFPILGILPIGQTTAPYAHEFIFLFLGGFVLALSMQRWGLDRRIALVTLSFVGTKPAFVIGGFMLITATLSMWVSNTATAAMMLPIAIAVIDLVRRQSPSTFSRDPQGSVHAEDADSGVNAPLRVAAKRDGSDTSTRNFALSLMLSIAYAASIGGIATIIGSPPNVILVGFLKDVYGIEISFAQWMLFGLPLVLIFLPLAWLMITWVLYPISIKRIEGGRQLIQSELKKLGPMKPGEWTTMIVFFCTAILWITRPLLSSITIGTGDDAIKPLAGLSDAGIAILAAMALFVIPSKTSKRPNVQTSKESDSDSKSRRSRASVWTFGRLDAWTFTMNWDTAKKLPWGVLILFGGGLSLAAAVQATGVAEFFGAQAGALRGVPAIVLVLAITAGVIFLTELTSNTATTATLLPILAGLAPGIGVPPEMLLFPAAIAASCAFMMPVATPPNAIVFGSGYLTIPQMAKAGIWLNLIGIGLVTLVLYFIILPIVKSVPL